MNYTIIERLDRIEKKLDGKFYDKFLSINQVSKLVELSNSTIRRSISNGTLKCSKKSGKLLFLESDIRKWIEEYTI